MNPHVKLLFFLIDIILPLAVGYLIRRRWGERDRLANGLIRFNIIVMITLLSVLSFWVMELQVQLLWLPVLGVVMQFVPGAAGYWRARRRFDDMDRRGSFVLSAMLSNRGYVGMLAVFILYGEVGYAYMRLTILLSGFVVFLFCFPMAAWFHQAHHGAAGEKRSFASLIFTRNQIPILGILAGLALNRLGPARPEWVGGAFPYAVHVSAWFGILPIGMSLEFGELRRHWRDAAELVPIKFVVNPAMVYALAWCVGLRGTALYTVVILAASPTAINSVITCKLHGLDIHLPVAAFILTTAVFICCVLPVLLVLL